jgi:signal transduction histidine kinase
MSLKDDPSLFAGQILSSVSDMIYVLDPVNNHLDFLNSRAADLLYVEPTGPKRGFEFFQLALHEEDRQRRSQHINTCLSMPDGRAKEIDVRLRVHTGHYRRFRIRDMVFARNDDGSVSQLTGIIRLLETAEPVTDTPSATDPRSAATPRSATPAQPAASPRSLAIPPSATPPRSPKDEEYDLPAKLLLGIVAQDYLEGLRQIYISLEIIISTEGHLFSNANKAHLRRSQSMVQKLNLLTRDVLFNAASTSQDKRSSRVDLTALLAEALSRMEGKIKASGAKIETETLPQVQGYPLLLSALFRHLLLHALKSGREGRPLRIGIRPGHAEDTRPPSVDPADTRPRPEGPTPASFLTITITDNGNGFDPADREKIFGISYQGLDKMKYRSSGAGLAIIKRIMEIHGGFIMADSVPGEGSTFTCYFPNALKS